MRSQETRRIAGAFLQRQTEVGNEVTPLVLALHKSGAGVNRKPKRRGIVSEANAHGKAVRYADGNTTIWKIEVQVEANTL